MKLRKVKLPIAALALTTLSLTGTALAGDYNKIPTDVVNDTKSAAQQIIIAAARGNINEVAEWTVEADKTRLEKTSLTEEQVDSIQQNGLSKKWEKTFNQDFSEALESSRVPMSVTEYDEKQHTAHVIVGEGSDAVKLKMVNTGTMGDAWRIDIPNDTSMQKIAQPLKEAAIDHSDAKHKSVLSHALKLLKPLSVQIS